MSISREAELPPLPQFDNLTLDPKGPKGNAWGLFSNTSLGMLNLLTPSNTARAAQEEIKTGYRVSLDWDLTKPTNPSFGRKGLQWELRNKAGHSINDDVLVEMNTQGSSQWDGFRHYGNQKHQCFYNGHTLHEIKNSSVIGIHAWTESGGIAGRGILLDYVSYCKEKNIQLPDAMTSTSIPVSTLKEIAASRDIQIRRGDILFIRSGWMADYSSLSTTVEKALAARPLPRFIGVESGEETLRWLWDCGFAAVAGDMPSFEVSPIRRLDGGTEEDFKHIKDDYILHEWLLAGWGMPIGEMFDLEKLSEMCEKEGRWTFFVTSAPLRIPGGVASPPNAIAIF